MANEIINMECSCIEVYEYRGDKKCFLGYVSKLLVEDGMYDCLVTQVKGRLQLYWPTGRSQEDVWRYEHVLNKLIEDCSDAGLVFERKTHTANFSIFNKDGLDYAREV